MGQICRAQKRIKIMHAWTADMEFFAYKLGCKPGRILFDSEKKKKENLTSRLVSLSCSSHEKVRAAKNTGWTAVSPNILEPPHV